MNKIFYLFIVFLLINFNLYSQNIDIKLFPINSFINNKLSKLSDDNLSLLTNKVNAITSNFGIGGENLYNPRFVLYIRYNKLKTNTISGNVSGILVKAEINMFIGDAFEKTIFSNVILPITGFGLSEEQAIVEAIRSINPKDEKFKKLIIDGISKINDYFISQCPIIINRAKSLAEIKKYDEAIFTLYNIPESTSSCHIEAADLIKKIYVNKINDEGLQNLKKAKLLWSSSQNNSSINQIISLIQDINPSSNSFLEVDKLINEINLKTQSNLFKEWLEKQEIRKEQLLKEKYRNDIEKIQIEAARDIAISYAKGTYITNNYTSSYNSSFYTTKIYETLFW